MAEKQDVSKCSASAAAMCANGCGFYGSAATMNFCSRCYKAAVAPVEATTEKKATTVINAGSSKAATAAPVPAMTQEQQDEAAAPIPCVGGCGFFGPTAKNNLCSKCFDEMDASKAADAPAIEEEAIAINAGSSSSSSRSTTKTATAAPPVPATTTAKTQDEAPTAPILCVMGCGFFGSAENKNMCSKCSLDSIINTVKAAAAPALLEKIEPDEAAPVAIEEQPAPAAAPPEAKAAAPNRCQACRKKVGLLGFVCRCGGTFCSLHRYMEKHSCDFDFKEAERERLSKNNPLVSAPKIDKI